MTPEQLMKPRYKLINNFPLANTTVAHYGESFAIAGKLFYSKDYPGVLKLMNWWEDREEKDLPQYVVVGTQLGRQFLKIDKAEPLGFYYTEAGREHFLLFGYAIPITEQQYLAQTR